MSLAAYKRTISDTESPRQIERRVLNGVTAELDRRAKEFDSTEKRIEKLQILADGLRHDVWRNQQIWMAFKSDLLNRQNGFDPQLRSSMLSLAVWVENHTQAVLAGAKKIQPLVEVNQSIIKGLEGGTFGNTE